MMEVGELYEDVVVDYFVVIKVLDIGKCGFECEIILSDDEKQIGEKHIFDKSYEEDFVLYNPNPKVRRLEWEQKGLQHMS